MLCCMFKYRRSSFVRRLWRLRLQNETQGAEETEEELELKSLAHAMLKRLKDKQLETFIQSVESQGGEEYDCVLLPKVETRVGKNTLTTLVLCCKMWRWLDITNSTRLKRLSCCKSTKDSSYECCNPYHWSVLTVPDIPEIDSNWLGVGVKDKLADILGINTNWPGLIVQDQLTDALDTLPDECISMETGMTPTPRQNFLDSSSAQYLEQNGFETGHSSHGAHWCTLAYWELSQRVGRLLTVFDTPFNIFQQLPHGDGLCLKILQEHCYSDSVTRTREKIGFGIVLSKESDGIWVYNRSHFPIFVNSPTLENPKSQRLCVHKVLPGHSLQIFHFQQVCKMDRILDPKYLDGPYDPSAIRISFVKGWGPNYSRQILTSCPCWMEIMLNVHR